MSSSPSRPSAKRIRDSAKFTLSQPKTTTGVVSLFEAAEVDDSPAEPVLLVLSGAAQGEFRLVEDTIRVGRDHEADLPIRDHGISWAHCAFHRISDEIVTVEDLGSTNGTWLSGARVTRPTPLRDGDRIQIGAATTIRFSLESRRELDLQREMYEAALTDGLTGLYNQRYFARRLSAEFEFARRQNRYLALVLLDLDHFKRVNDTHGHLAGNAILEQVGIVLRSRARLEDICCRYGGEEFAVICRETPATRALTLAERLRAAVEEIRVGWQDHSLRITASFGVAAMCPSSDALVTQLVSLCDESLYAAKQQGRNRVVPSTECI